MGLNVCFKISATFFQYSRHDLHFSGDNDEEGDSAYSASSSASVPIHLSPAGTLWDKLLQNGRRKATVNQLGDSNTVVGEEGGVGRVEGGYRWEKGGGGPAVLLQLVGGVICLFGVVFVIVVYLFCCCHGTYIRIVKVHGRVE